MKTISQAISNTFYLFLNWIGQTFFGYLFWIVLAKLLLSEQVGVFSTVLNAGLFIAGFSMLGLNVAAMKLIPEYQSKNRAKKIKATVYYTLKFSLVVNFILVFLIFIFSSSLAKLGYLSETEIVTMAIILFSIYLLYLSGNYIYALQKMRKLFIMDTAFAFSKLLISIFLILLGFSYFGAVAGVIISALVFSIMRLKNVPIGRERADVKKIWYYAVPALVGGGGIIFLNQGNIIALSILSNMSAVGIFTVAFMLATPIKIIPQVISQSILPITSQQWVLEEKFVLNKTITQSLKYSYLFAIPIMFMFIVFTREILVLFTTQKYLEGILPIQILSIAYLFFGLSTILVGVLYFTGKPNINRNINLVAGFANIFLCVLLIPFFGILGAALSFLVSCLIMFIASFYYSYRHLKFSLTGWQLAKNLLASFLFILTLFVFRQFDTSLLAILIATIFASSVYIISLIYMRFFDVTDLKILKWIEEKSPKKFRLPIRYVRKILEWFV